VGRGAGGRGGPEAVENVRETRDLVAAHVQHAEAGEELEACGERAQLVAEREELGERVEAPHGVGERAEEVAPDVEQRQRRHLRGEGRGVST
jgi:hypothetical protein